VCFSDSLTGISLPDEYETFSSPTLDGYEGKILKLLHDVWKDNNAGDFGETGLLRLAQVI
jgi:hypothetical protein